MERSTGEVFYGEKEMRYLTGLIIFLSASIILMLPVPAHADALRYQNSQMTLTLLEEPCKHKKILAMLTDSFKPKFKRADLIWEGKQLSACWIAIVREDDDKRYVIVDETGDRGFLLSKDFSVIEGI